MSSGTAYQVVEPTQSSSRPVYHSGRGGAGNIVDFTSSSSITPVPTTLDPHAPKTYKSGRGGVGNIHPSSERAIFSFDEELDRQMRMDSNTAPVFHVGRGGAGNVVQDGQQSSRAGSASSDGSADSNASEKLSRGDQIRAKLGIKDTQKGTRSIWGKMLESSVFAEPMRNGRALAQHRADFRS